MTRSTSIRRSLTAIVQRAIQSGHHRVDISPDGKVTILPLSVSPVQAEDAALDAEIRDLLNDGHAPH